MNSLQVVLSFSGLLLMVVKGRFNPTTDDNQNVIYYFGCTKAGIQQTIENSIKWNRLKEKDAETVLKMLEQAEIQDRVFWRSQDSTDHFHLTWLKNQLESRGAILVKDFDVEHYSHNIPSMTDFINSITNLKVTVHYGS